MDEQLTVFKDLEAGSAVAVGNDGSVYGVGIEGNRAFLLIPPNYEPDFLTKDFGQPSTLTFDFTVREKVGPVIHNLQALERITIRE